MVYFALSVWYTDVDCQYFTADRRKSAADYAIDTGKMQRASATLRFDSKWIRPLRVFAGMEL